VKPNPRSFSTTPMAACCQVVLWRSATRPFRILPRLHIVCLRQTYHCRELLCDNEKRSGTDVVPKLVLRNSPLGNVAASNRGVNFWESLTL